MIEKIDNIRPTEFLTTPLDQRVIKNDVLSSKLPASDVNLSNKNVIEDVSLVSEALNPATTKTSEFSSETLAQKQMNLKEAVEQINSELTSLQSDLGFSVDFETNKNVVTVTRKESGEVVRQIPSETVLNIAHNIEKLKGVLFDRLI